MEAAFMSPLSIRLIDGVSYTNNSKPPLAICEINNLSAFLYKTKQPAITLPGMILCFFVLFFSLEVN